MNQKPIIIPNNETSQKGGGNDWMIVVLIIQVGIFALVYMYFNFLI